MDTLPSLSEPAGDSSICCTCCDVKIGGGLPCSLSNEACSHWVICGWGGGLWYFWLLDPVEEVADPCLGSIVGYLAPVEFFCFLRFTVTNPSLSCPTACEASCLLWLFWAT
ncbi:hypothetical protein M758_UG031300 [Ceratodon purpureus]|nr:hypothetical protein M758_UG031300 [Ceratodon purpureus]